MRLVADLMAVRIVDELEIVDIEDDGRQAAVRRDDARASFGRVLEEAAAIAEPGQRIDGGEPDQLVLHRQDALGGAEPRVKLLGQRRLADEIVGARVQRLDQAALVVLAGHHQHIDRTPAGGEQPRLPAQLDTRNMLELGAGNQGVDAGIGPDLSKRFKLIGERNDIVPARFQHASNDQSRRATGID